MRGNWQSRPARWAFLTGIYAALVSFPFWIPHPAWANDVPIDSPQAQAEAQRLAAEPPKPPPPAKEIRVDHSGRKESGKASIYGPHFNGRTTASGQPLNPHANVAASKTLPLGTVARVTNLQNGKSTDVKVEDRGPFVSGRVVDLTPHAAQQIGLTKKQGVAPVIVAPVLVPQPDGTLKPGAGAAEGDTAAEARQAVPGGRIASRND
jgi:rare lipoprotein A